MIAVACETATEENPMTSAVALSTFRISEDDWADDPAIKAAYDDYSSKLYGFGDAMRDLKQATKNLHDLLDGPLRNSGLIPAGKDRTLKEDEEARGINIQVWSEPKQRGRQRPDIPIKRLTLARRDKLGKSSLKDGISVEAE
jgi:hypothetical protein